MAKACDGQTMPMECVQRFEAGAEKMAVTGEHIAIIIPTLKEICLLLKGNGEPSHGIISRVEKLEAAATIRAKAKAIWSNRRWTILTAVLASILGIVATLLVNT